MMHHVRAVCGVALMTIALQFASACTATPPPPTTLAGWAALRQCESGGNYRAVSATGKYRGAYQFDARTWGSVGGSGDPAAASKDEQDARAYRLYRARGSQPWTCGYRLRRGY